MADLTPDKVKEIIAKKPANVSAEEVVQSLMDAGHKLLPAQAAPEQPTALGFPVHTIPQSIPLIGGTQVADVAAPIAAQGKKLADFLRTSGQQTEQIVGGRTGQALNLAAQAGASFVPETSGQVYANVAMPLATFGLGKAAGAAAKTQAGQAALRGAAQFGSSLTKIPADVYKKAIEMPIFSRALGNGEAGNIMNRFYGQFGLKSGSEALEIVAKKKGLAAPKLGDFRRFTNETIKKIENEESTLAKIKEIEKAMMEKAKVVGTDLPDALVKAEAQFGKNSAEVKAIRDKLHDLKTVVMKEGIVKLKPLIQQLPNPQDALAARQYLSKIARKQSFQAAEDKVVTPIALKNLNVADDYITKELEKKVAAGTTIEPIKVKGYGDITTPEQVRNLWHESKINESFNSLVPLTRAGNPDALRFTLSVLSQNPLALAQSPVLNKAAINTIKSLGKAGTGAKVAAFGTALSKQGNKEVK